MNELEQYDYQLPAELIAQHPLPCRSDARLMLVDRQADAINHAHVRDLPELLRAGDCLVTNNSRVIPARLVGYRTETGGRWQGLFLGEQEHGVWRLLCKTRGKLRPGTMITLVDRQARDAVQLRMVLPLEQGQWAARPQSDEATAALLDRIGRVPLPAYIREGEMVDADREDYQTVFASQPGSVAAPTAGLHFTRRLIQQLEATGITTCQVTLHVGPGTFRPIAAEKLSDHPMHSEWASIDEQAVRVLQQTRAMGQRVVAVGSTSMRVLETAALQGQLEAWSGETRLFIRPPFDFQVVDAFLTNFHLPRSTLLVLVRTFGGDRLIRRAYDEAIKHCYRFYSYGDAMLIV
jgi:S-adenosylmethionine:tRNA ribosyltransferase-isomerase